MERAKPWWALKPGPERAALKAATETETKPVEVFDDGKAVTGRWRMRYCHPAHRSWARLAVQVEDHRSLAKTLNVKQSGDVLTLNGRYSIRTDASPTETETLLEIIHADR